MGYGDLIHKYAERHHLAPEVVASVVFQESKGNPWAVRYEDAFYKRYIIPQKPLIGHTPKIASLDTERRLRAHSFGLMQVMGQTAREFGFKGEYFTEICDPEIGLDYGCLALSAYIHKKGSLRGGLKRYNGGDEYPDLIFRHLETRDFERVL